MKRSWLTTAFVCILILGGGGLILGWPRTVPIDQCSDMYKKYVDKHGVDATFIKDYKVNDSVFVDVTLLETKDSAQWDGLCRDMGIALFSMPTEDSKKQLSDKHSFSYRLIKDTITSGLSNTIKKDLVVFSQLKMTMCIFHNVSDADYAAIINKKYEEITH